MAYFKAKFWGTDNGGNRDTLHDTKFYADMSREQVESVINKIKSPIYGFYWDVGDEERYGYVTLQEVTKEIVDLEQEIEVRQSRLAQAYKELEDREAFSSSWLQC